MLKAITINGVHLEPNRKYDLYRADDCRLTGLPMLDKAARYADGMPELMSITQRRKSGHPVQPDELPVAWYRMCYGYAPLYPPGGAEDD